MLGEREPAGAAVATREGRTPHELFDAYLAEEEIDDARLSALFAELLDAETRA